MSLIEKQYTLHMEFITPVLGGIPKSNIALDYVKSKQIEDLAKELRKAGKGYAAAQEEAEAKVKADFASMVDGSDEDEELKVTGFYRDLNGIMLRDYHVKYYIKHAAKALGLKIPGARNNQVYPYTDITNLVWVQGNNDDPTALYFKREGGIIAEPDGLFNRPLRTSGPMGDRTTIATAEIVEAPVHIYATINLLRGCRFGREHIEQALSYGEFMGISPWRTASYGRFKYDLAEAKS